MMNFYVCHQMATIPPIQCEIIDVIPRVSSPDDAKWCECLSEEVSFTENRLDVCIDGFLNKIV